MKPILLLFFWLSSIGILIGQTPVRVEVKIQNQYLQNDDEWKSFLTADLYDEEDQFVEPSENYYYTWELKVNNGSWNVFTSGSGIYNPEPDGHWYEVSRARVSVTVGDSVIQSDDLIISLGFEPIESFFFPKKQDGTDLTTDNLVLQHWSGSTWTLHQISASPESLPPESGIFLGIEKDEQLKVEPYYAPSIGQKFHHWNSTGSNIVNFSTFNIESSDPFRARFHSVENDAILNVSSVESSSGLTMGLKDPWLVNFQDGALGYRNLGMDASFIAHSTGFNPNSNSSGAGSEHKGIFLDQTTQGGVYYSVRAAETQTVNGFPWVFWKWDTSGAILTSPTTITDGYYTSPVIFKSWGTRTVTANYKAHLASNASDVLSSYGQRRLVAGEVGSNVEHLLVYGSAGSIWASYKAGSGAWGNEVCISGTSSNHAAPSASWGGTYVPVVWRSGSSGSYSVLFNKRSSGSWLASPVTVASSLASFPDPVIAFRTLAGSMTRRPHVAYRTGDTDVTMRWSTDDGASWPSSSTFTEANGVGTYSLSAFNTLDVYDAILTLAYISNMRTYVRDFQGSWGSCVLVPTSEGEQRFWGGFELMMTDNSLPQVIRGESDDRTTVCFNQYQEYFDGDWQWLTLYFQIVQSRDSQGNWGTATAYETGTYGGPSLSFVNNKYTMLWEDAGTLNKAQESQGTWGEPASTGSGAEPTLAVSSGALIGSAHYVWRENASGLYKIVPSSSQMSRTVAQQHPVKSAATSWVYSRVISMIDTTTGAVFSATVSNAQLAGRPVPLAWVNDTLPGITAGNFFSFLQTEPTSARSEDTLFYELSLTMRGWLKDAGTVDVRLCLTDGTNEQALGNVLVDLSRSSRPFKVAVPVGSCASGLPRIEIEASFPEWAGRCVFNVSHVYRKPASAHATAETQQAAAGRSAESEEMLTAYPNPFNPTTQIQYRLNEGGWVRVAVYDLLGRQIEVLVDAQKAAGAHNAIWNADGLPSGTYLCRLSVNAGGRNTVRTIKMQYVR